MFSCRPSFDIIVRHNIHKELSKSGYFALDVLITIYFIEKKLIFLLFRSSIIRIPVLVIFSVHWNLNDGKNVVMHQNKLVALEWAEKLLLRKLRKYYYPSNMHDWNECFVNSNDLLFFFIAKSMLDNCKNNWLPLK